MTAAVGLVEQRDGPLLGRGSSSPPVIVGTYGGGVQRRHPELRDRPTTAVFSSENAENRTGSFSANTTTLVHFRQGDGRKMTVYGDERYGVECPPWVHVAAASPQLQLHRYNKHHPQQQQRTCPPSSQQGQQVSRAHPNAMARRNERERKRVRMVNMGFATLRQYLPHVGRKKLSKMETLRSAIDYIKQLQTMLDSHDRSTFDLMTGGSSPSHHHQWPAVEKERNQNACSRYPCQASLWDDGVTTGWATPRSPGSSLGSEASSPSNSLSPELEVLEFSSLP